MKSARDQLQQFASGGEVQHFEGGGFATLGSRLRRALGLSTATPEQQKAEQAKVQAVFQDVGTLLPEKQQTLYYNASGYQNPNKPFKSLAARLGLPSSSSSPVGLFGSEQQPTPVLPNWLTAQQEGGLGSIFSRIVGPETLASGTGFSTLAAGTPKGMIAITPEANAKVLEGLKGINLDYLSPQERKTLTDYQDYLTRYNTVIAEQEAAAAAQQQREVEQMIEDAGTYSTLTGEMPVAKLPESAPLRKVTPYDMGPAAGFAVATPTQNQPESAGMPQFSPMTPPTPQQGAYIPYFPENVDLLSFLEQSNAAPATPTKQFAEGGEVKKFARGGPADFNWQDYVNRYEDLRNAGIDTQAEAVRHWNQYGKNENRSYTPLAADNWLAGRSYKAELIPEGFNWQTYVNANADLRNAGIDTETEAKRHFALYGVNESRSGAPAVDNWLKNTAYEATNVPTNFDWKYYVAKYPDLRAAGIDTQAEAQRHYALYGQGEGRLFADQLAKESTMQNNGEYSTLTGSMPNASLPSPGGVRVVSPYNMGQAAGFQMGEARNPTTYEQPTGGLFGPSTDVATPAPTPQQGAYIPYFPENVDLLEFLSKNKMGV